MYRPWGWLDWALELSEPKRWKLYGCVGPEERSVSAPIAFRKRDILEKASLLRVIEPESPYAEEASECIQARERSCHNAKVRPDVLELSLFAPMTELDDLCDNASGSVVLDISSMPKRFFFYLLKRFAQSRRVRDLLITYTLPAAYPEGALAGDYDTWQALPSFRPIDPDVEKQAQTRLIVNIGFLPSGLVAHLSGPAEERKIDILIPFPAPAITVRRVWKAVWALRRPAHMRFSEVRVAANDMSEAFDVILSLVPPETNFVSFAPFGPKPISAAMCLYATLTDCPVYYAQPKMYRPDYSVGVARVNRIPAINTYWVKHDGHSLYQLPSARRKLSRAVRRKRITEVYGTRA